MGVSDLETSFLTLVYVLCFQLCAWPAIARIVRRGSSDDLSIWRELILLVGVACQFTVMQATGADWKVWISPLLSATNITVLLILISRYRTGG